MTPHTPTLVRCSLRSPAGSECSSNTGVLLYGGVTVTTLCPGPTNSEFKVRAGSQRSRLFEAFVMDAPTVAKVGYEGMMAGRTVVIPGLRNQLIPIAARLVPRPMLAVLSHRAARPSEK